MRVVAATLLWVGATLPAALAGAQTADNAQMHGAIQIEQEVPEQEPKTPAQKQQEQREREAQEQQAQSSYDLIRREREAALIRYNYMLPGLRTERKRKAAYEKHYPIPARWAPRFFEVHERFPQTWGAGKALIWIVTHLDSGPLELESRRLLLRQHIARPELTAVCSALKTGQRPGEQADLLRLFEKSPIPEVRSGALIQLCRADLRAWQAERSPTRREGLEQRLAMLELSYGNLYFEGRKGSAWAKELIREMAHLTLGQQFLDWKAQTLSGDPRSLNDLRGKVVVLFFWKSGSVGSRKIVPHVKAFWNRRKGSKVVLLGVSGDVHSKKAERWSSILDLPFEQWHAPPTIEEPNPFGVDTWPSFFVLNGEGLILAARSDWETALNAAERELQRVHKVKKEAEQEAGPKPEDEVTPKDDAKTETEATKQPEPLPRASQSPHASTTPAEDLPMGKPLD